MYYSRRKGEEKEKKIQDVSHLSQECNEEVVKYHHLKNEL